MSELFFQSLFSGILAGSAYALVALGLALIFGTMKIINLAHGELVLLGGYIAYTVESKLGLNPFFAIPVAIVIVCAASAFIYVLLSRIRVDRDINSLIMTYGIGLMLTNLILLIWSADIHSSSSEWLQDAVSFGQVYAMHSEIVSFAIGIALLGAVWLWLSKSWYGKAIRAVSSNRDAAKIMGINPFAIELVAFLLSGILAAVAGVTLYSFQVIQPILGESLTIKAFVITVLAGIGSIPGVLIGALLLGICDTMTATYLNSGLQQLSTMVIFLLVLLLRPNGLFGAAGRRG